MMKAKCVVAEVSQDFDFGTLGGAWRFVVTSVDPAVSPQTIDSDTSEAEFQLAAGDYTLTAQRLDVNKAPLGPSGEQAFRVEAPAKVSINVVGGLNVTLSAN